MPRRAPRPKAVRGDAGLGSCELMHGQLDEPHTTAAAAVTTLVAPNGSQCTNRRVQLPPRSDDHGRGEQGQDTTNMLAWFPT